MKKSKIISLLSIVIFIISIIYTICNYNITPSSNYSLGNQSITGIITSCTYKEEYVKITLKAKEKIIVNHYDDFTCVLGQAIKVTGEVKEISTFNNINLFDYQKYLYSLKINYILSASKIEVVDNSIPLSYQIKNKLTNYINNFKSYEYLDALVLGNTKEIDEDIIDSYRQNGISHLLAISGMHITLLSLIILKVLSLFIKNKKVNYLLVVTMLIFYAFLVNFTPAVIRAISLFIVLTIKKIFELKVNTVYLLLFICGINLLYNPYLVYNIGFLFSYIISFYIILFSKYITGSYITKTFKISLVAFLASIPILINNFYSINLLSPFINIIFVPLISFVIYPLSLLTLIVPPLDNLLYILINYIESLSLLISDIDYFIITLKHISISIVIMYYLLITYTIYTFLNKKYHGILLFIVVMAIHTNINYFDRYPTITMLDVGQGDSILIKLPHNQGNILIDTGGLVSYTDSEPYDIASNITIPYLKSEGVKQIDYLILTHGDYDHAGMAINLINGFSVRNIIFNTNDNSLEKEIKALAKTKDIAYNNYEEEVLKIDNYKFYFLKSNSTSDENTNSLVIYTKLNKKNILFMGDADSDRESYILSEYNLPQTDILKVGHHGSKTSSSEEFINAINPKISLISAGKNNMYGHPHEETLEVLKNSNTLITSVDGAIKLTLKKSTIYQTAR